MKLTDILNAAENGAGIPHENHLMFSNGYDMLLRIHYGLMLKKSAGTDEPTESKIIEFKKDE